MCDVLNYNLDRKTSEFETPPNAQVGAFISHFNRTLPNHKRGTPTPQMGVREGVVVVESGG